MDACLVVTVLNCAALDWNWQTFSEKGQILDIFGSVSKSSYRQ